MKCLFTFVRSARVCPTSTAATAAAPARRADSARHRVDEHDDVLMRATSYRVRNKAERPTIACADKRCDITLLHRECVDVDGGARRPEEENDYNADGVLRTRWHCELCALATPIYSLCDSYGAAPDAPSTERSSCASPEYRGQRGTT